MLIDTSVWIDLLGKARRHRVSSDQLQDVVTCPPIIQEVFQGIKADGASGTFKDRFLALVRVGDPMELDLYLAAADIYLSGRRKGLTIRSSIDCLIAAVALRHDLVVWHDDRDFETIGKYTSLKTTTASAL